MKVFRCVCCGDRDATPRAPICSECEPAPVIRGPVGTATRQNDPPGTLQPSPSLGGWLLDLPGAATPVLVQMSGRTVARVNMLARWHVLDCVTLRPMDGYEKAVLDYPGAAYQLTFAMLDPDMKEGTPPPFPLHGVKWYGQFDFGDEADDALARSITTMAAWAVVYGGLPAPPDKMTRATWDHSLAESVRHWTTGHP